MEEKALQVINIEDYAMTPDIIRKQVNLIQEVMEKVMKKDEHYGNIPGCGPKPTLLKPGAEKLCVTFRLAPTYKIEKTEMQNGHREYEVVCTLTHINSGLIVGEGVGSCSTMESKYRYRTGEVEPIGKPVPRNYWDDRDQNLIGGKGFSVKKIEGKWEIVKAGKKIEHDNPADYYNTVLKMAKKRSLVDASLTATAASDIFTQDIEDMPIEESKNEPSEPKEAKIDSPPDGRTKEGKNFKYLKSMKELKYEIKALDGNEEAYYQCLGVHGYEKSNQITDRKDQEKVYKNLKSYIDNKKKEG